MNFDESDDEKKGFFQRNRWASGVIIGAIILVAGGLGWWISSQKEEERPKPKPPPVIAIQVPPPPPPPPPPEPEEEPDEEEMVEPEDEPEEAPPDEPPPEAPPATGITGEGDNAFGLSAEGGAGFFGSGAGGGGNRQWTRYAAGVRNEIADAIRRHPNTRRAGFVVTVRVWVDGTGKIERSTLEGSTGNRRIDEILPNEVITGLRLASPPPTDLPMPIVMRIRAERP